MAWYKWHDQISQTANNNRFYQTLFVNTKTFIQHQHPCHFMQQIDANLCLICPILSFYVIISYFFMIDNPP
ncbi:hypothetical protein [Moraxella lacunata]|uniref:hypothetical protein n=1 Tax=Moraxella lacunata TaxID=477 RepID=UPI003EE3A754